MPTDTLKNDGEPKVATVTEDEFDDLMAYVKEIIGENKCVSQMENQ